MKQLKDSLLAELDEFPPVLCRLLARTPIRHRPPHMRAMTAVEIAKAGNLTVQRVGRLSVLRTWRDIAVGEADRFRSACGLGPRALRRQREFLSSPRRGPNMFRHLDHPAIPYKTRLWLGKLLLDFVDWQTQQHAQSAQQHDPGQTRD